MHTLFAISIVAGLALLWASISIAQHVRRARERREAVDDAKVEDANQPAVGFEDEGLKEQQTSVSPPPVPFANANKGERMDWAGFNKDLGDRGEPRDPSIR
jgi:hypothetical protein